MSKSFSREISFGGKLIVNESSWHVDYYFKGPDTRYQGAHLIIKDIEVDQFISELTMNYARYESLKEEYKGQIYEETVTGDMKIKIGSLYQGVYVLDQYFVISSKRKLNKFIESLHQCKTIVSEGKSL